MESSTTYRQISQFLVHDLPKSIDVVPGSATQWSENLAINPHHPFLLLDGNLGIPQSVLYKTYVLAVKELSHLPKPRRVQNMSLYTGEHTELVSSTAIILLANPSHNTALNRRKQLIQLKSPLLTPHLELKYSAALLSNIKQASKSSILWHHRRWILRHIYGSTTTEIDSTQHDSDVLSHIPIPCDVLASEFELAARASEIYPRNYHAWLHRYLCMQCILSRASEGNAEARVLLQLELKNSQRWVDLHVSDYTAMQYLARFVLALQGTGTNVALSDPFSSMSDSPSISGQLRAEESLLIRHALYLVSYYPAHESLWMYLRLAIPIARGQNSSLHQWIIDFASSVCDILWAENHKGLKHDHDAPQALVKRIKTETLTDDVSRVRKFAIRLFIWTTVLSGGLYLSDTTMQNLTRSESLDPEHLQRLCSV